MKIGQFFRDAIYTVNRCISAVGRMSVRWWKGSIDEEDPLLRSSRDNRLTIQQKRRVWENYCRMRDLRAHPWTLRGLIDRIRRGFKRLVYDWAMVPQFNYPR